MLVREATFSVTSAGLLNDALLSHCRSVGFDLRFIETSTDENHLSLIDLHDAKKQPLSVDFLAPALCHRLRQGLSYRDLLPRALGVRNRESATRTHVIDTTAGLGVDAWTMAALGCRVTGVERSPVLNALLVDGLERLKRDATPTSQAIAERLEFIHDDSSTYLRRLTASFDQFDSRSELESVPELEADSAALVSTYAVYLDPMYPSESHSKSALPKKTMQFFRRLLGDDSDAFEILTAAREFSSRVVQSQSQSQTASVPIQGHVRARIAVKRPLKGESLGSAEPLSAVVGKTVRFDIY